MTGSTQLCECVCVLGGYERVDSVCMCVYRGRGMRGSTLCVFVCVRVGGEGYEKVDSVCVCVCVGV